MRGCCPTQVTGEGGWSVWGHGDGEKWSDLDMLVQPVARGPCVAQHESVNLLMKTMHGTEL